MVKVERSFPAPSSLAEEAQKKNGSYEKEDVVEQLKEDFHNKCYICELKWLQDPQVEHLLPHKNGKYKDRKFDWENLFWVCAHCNGIKNQKLIDFQLNDDNVKLIRNFSVQDDEIDRTILLIWEVFNRKNTGMRVYKSAMRFKALRTEMNLLFDNLEQLKQEPGSIVVLRKLRALLRRESAFAAFKRSYVRKHLLDYPELESYI